MKNLLATFLVVVLGTGCATQAQTGAMTGAAAGAAIGALTSKNKISGAAIGAGGGLLLGYLVGNEMDKWATEEVVESQPSGVPRVWREPDGTITSVTFNPIQQYGSTVRREVLIKNTSSAVPSRFVGRKTADGTWIFQKVR